MSDEAKSIEKQLDHLWRKTEDILKTYSENLTTECIKELISTINQITNVIAGIPSELANVLCRFCERCDLYNAVYHWTGEHRKYMKQMASVQLSCFVVLLENADTKILTCKKIIVPLMLLLLSLKPTDKRKIPPEIELSYVKILYFISLRISEKEFLDLLSHDLYTANEEFRIPRFTFFELLILYTHNAGDAGDLARKSILVCLETAKINNPFNDYICYQTAACVIIAGGLSARYSSLPTTLDVSMEDWHYITYADLGNMKELQAFLHSLSFCCKVVETSSSGVSTKLSGLITDGFLKSVLAPALNQPLVDAQIAVIAYLELFVRSIVSEKVLCVFLRVLLTDDYEGKPLVNLLICHINSRSEALSMVAMQLFKTLLELNCEDVLFHLVFRYLLPCNHILPNQKRTIKEMDFYCKSAAMFLYLTPACCIGNKDDSECEDTRLSAQQSCEFMAYLCDAKSAIIACKRSCRCWSNVYDGMDVVSEVMENRYSRYGDILRRLSATSSPVTFNRSLSTASTDSDGIARGSLFDVKFPAFKTDCLGPFLNVLFDKLEGMMENSVYLNLQLTSLVTRLAYYPQPLLRSFLLNSNLVIQPGVRSLSRVLAKVSRSSDDFVTQLHDYRLLIDKARLNLNRREERRFKRLSRDFNNSHETVIADEEKRDCSISIDPRTGSGNFSYSNHSTEESPVMKVEDILQLTPSSVNTSTPVTINDRESRRTSTFSSRPHGKLHPVLPKFSTRSPNRKEHAKRPMNEGECSEPRIHNALAIKNSIYCVIVLDEFMKELAAVSIEQTLL